MPPKPAMFFAASLAAALPEACAGGQTGTAPIIDKTN